MYKITFLLFLFLCTLSSFAQEAKEKNWLLSGYVKNLQTVFVLDGGTNIPKQTLTDNLIHNRLNFKWYWNDAWTFKADLRTRLLYGETVKLNNLISNNTYAQQVDESSNDILDLSAVVLDENAFVLHSVLDRLYVEWSKGKWEIRAGRQRINWGISTVWNPNDVFNAFSFTDFDYEERPGSDALRIKYYTGFASSIELASKWSVDKEKAVAAALLKLNKGNYDFQILGAYVQNELAFGGGWAGNLGGAGFKGEFTYFHPLEGEGADSFAATLGLDYSFKNALVLGAGFLYNSNGQASGSIEELFSFDLSAKNLYPYQYSIFVQSSYPITPILYGVMAFIYSPSEAHPLFVTPTLTYSIRENWDIDLVGQLAFNSETNRTYFSPLQAFFGRIKFSF